MSGARPLLLDLFCGAGGAAMGYHWERAMGIGWMTVKELAQAIPPAYTEYIGGQLINHVCAFNSSI